MVLLGNPFVANVTKQLSNDELVQAIRVDIAGEYEAIIGYEAHSMATNPQEAQSIEQGRQVIRQQQAQNFQQPLQ